MNDSVKFALLELPRDRVRAFGDEGLAERTRVLRQAPLQDGELLLKELDALAVLEFFELVFGRLDLAGGDDVAAQILAVAQRRRLEVDRGVPGRFLHRMISASQSAAMRDARLIKSGVISMRSSTPGITRATSFVTPPATIFVFSKSSPRF